MNLALSISPLIAAFSFGVSLTVIVMLTFGLLHSIDTGLLAIVVLNLAIINSKVRVRN